MFQVIYQAIVKQTGPCTTFCPFIASGMDPCFECGGRVRDMYDVESEEYGSSNAADPCGCIVPTVHLHKPTLLTSVTGVSIKPLL